MLIIEQYHLVALKTMSNYVF